MSQAQRNTNLCILAITLVIGLTVCLAGGAALAQDKSNVTLGRPVPSEILDPPWLDARRQAQLQTADAFGVFVGFRFVDRREASGIGFRNRVVEDAAKTYKAVHYDHGNGIAVADVDGDPDLYVTAVRTGNQLFENLGGGRFRDISEASGLGHRGHSSGAVFFDYDRDGLLDLFLTNVGQYTSDLLRIGDHEGYQYRFYDGFDDAFGGHNFDWRSERSLLFRNLGGKRFEDVTHIMSEPDTGWSGDAAAADLNGDGWPDLYALNMQGHDQYYQNRGGEAFERKSRERFPKTSWGAMGIKVFDWNNDDRLLEITEPPAD